jgi:hypothetical protein
LVGTNQPLLKPPHPQQPREARRRPRATNMPPHPNTPPPPARSLHTPCIRSLRAPHTARRQHWGEEICARLEQMEEEHDDVQEMSRPGRAASGAPAPAATPGGRPGGGGTAAPAGGAAAFAA